MTITLGIDTSAFVAVGVAVDGEALARVVVEDTRAHAEALMPAVLQACAQAGVALRDVDEFVVGMGPGPFTGLRVGIATAWTLAHAAGGPRTACARSTSSRASGRTRGPRTSSWSPPTPAARSCTGGVTSPMGRPRATRR